MQSFFSLSLSLNFFLSFVVTLPSDKVVVQLVSNWEYSNQAM